MMLDHYAKLDQMRRHMAALGVPAGTAAPPAWRLLWWLGVRATPPLFMPALPLALCLGGFFAVCWGLLMWFGFWSGREGGGWARWSRRRWRREPFSACR